MKVSTTNANFRAHKSQCTVQIFLQMTELMKVSGQIHATVKAHESQYNQRTSKCQSSKAGRQHNNSRQV